jgi:cation diffusion facilitator CzcD-associated flavoprotein CzcO
MHTLGSDYTESDDDMHGAYTSDFLRSFTNLPTSFFAATNSRFCLSAQTDILKSTGFMPKMANSSAGEIGRDVTQAQERYIEERAKRLRDDGTDQFIDISQSDQFASFMEDPWIGAPQVKNIAEMFPGDRCQLLIVGAGLGGLLYGVRMIEAGIPASNIRIIDTAAGFGGTWYWNRYPGLTCDIESYMYLPLLEETGYVPKHRYSSGDEIRTYAELVAERWGLTASAVWQTKAEKLSWDEGAKEWLMTLAQQHRNEAPQELNIRTPFVAAVNGALNWPKLPGIVPGMFDYKGDIFHSSRWNYALTGGSPVDPSLTKLRGKKVAIIGTGATAVQLVPHLAQWAEHLYVIQRTPSAVDQRDQRETDIEWFNQNVATSTGWQRERLRNFHAQFTTEKQPEPNLVNDAWTSAVGMVAVSGNKAGAKSMEDVPAYVAKLHALDLPRQTRIRQRVEQTVKDPVVARNLQAWYPTWCKRPAFHDEYLPTFNRNNVTLLDTNGKGLDRVTAHSVIVGEQAYDVDMIICATGFRLPFTVSPAQNANANIIGRDDISMSERWAQQGPSTLHGVLDHNFPNLFISGLWQASNSPNYLFTVDTLATHSAYILRKAKHEAGDRPFAVAPTAAAAEDWAMQVLEHSVPMVAAAGCTPGYFNVEGAIDRAPPEAHMLMARSGLWGHGIEDFVQVVEKWRENGQMQGIEVRT